MSRMKTRAMMSAKIVTGVFGVTLNFIGAKWFSIEGVVGAGIVFSAAYLIWMALLVRRHSRP
jgi:hypothetical protein